MAVLCEAISVVVKRSSIDQYFRGGWNAYQAFIPNATHCTDGELARVGFLSAGEVGLFVDTLIAGGLIFRVPKKAFGIFGGGRSSTDIVVVDQLRGATIECDWIQFTRVEIKGVQVSICWLFEGEKVASGIHTKGLSMDLAVPDGWTPKESASFSFKEGPPR